MLIATLEQMDLTGKVTVSEEGGDYIAVSSLLDSLGFEETLGVMEKIFPHYRDVWGKFAWWCANETRGKTTDERVHQCLSVTKRYLDGDATPNELWESYTEVEEAVKEAEDDEAYATAQATYYAAVCAEGWITALTPAVLYSGGARRKCQIAKLRGVLDNA